MTRWILLLFAALGAMSAVRAEEVKFDFRKKNFDERWFKYDGAGSGECVVPADDGLRIHFPGNKVPKDPVGIVWNCTLRGDFVATARYSILKADRTPQGSGVEIYLMLANDTEDGIPVLRVDRGGDGLVFNCLMRTYDDKKKRVTRGFQQAKTTADSDRGRIRVERKGGDFFASLAEGDQEEFKTVLTIEDISKADVRMLRFAGISRGAAEAKLDVRLLELQLRGELVDLPGGTGAKEVAAPPALPPNSSGRWTLWIVIILGGVLLFVFLAVVALVGLTRWKGKAPPPSAKGKKK